MIRWKEKVMDHWDMINNLAERRFRSTGLAEEASLFVLERLAEGNWKRVRKFSGESSFKTYLSSVTYRLLEDFSRKKFGRKRPPGWIKKLGGIWLDLFRLLCLQRVDLTEAVERAAQIFKTEKKEDIEEKGLRLLEKVVDCGAHQALEVSMNEERIVEQSGRTQMSQEQWVEREEKDLLFQAIFSNILATDGEQKVYKSSQKAIKIGIELQTEERLLLKLCYQDGLSVTEAGRMLGCNRNQVHGRLRRLLGRLRHEFEKMDLDNELLLLLSDD